MIPLSGYSGTWRSAPSSSLLVAGSSAVVAPLEAGDIVIVATAQAAAVAAVVVSDLASDHSVVSASCTAATDSTCTRH